MAMKVVGTRVGSFKRQNTGEFVAFGKVYVMYPASEEMKGVKGEIAEGISIKPEMAAQIPVGSEIELRYNKWGKVDDFEIVSA